MAMLTKHDKKAIIMDIPKLKEMKAELQAMHRRTNTTGDYRKVINSLYCQVFAAVIQFERKLSENASNEAKQLPLIETVGKDAPGMKPVYYPFYYPVFKDGVIRFE
jgi:hypothetical protein